MTGASSKCDVLVYPAVGARENSSTALYFAPSVVAAPLRVIQIAVTRPMYFEAFTPLHIGRRHFTRQAIRAEAVAADNMFVACGATHGRPLARKASRCGYSPRCS